METMKAKELFFHYNGSFFHMHREGDYYEYKKYNIDKETENKWIEELCQVRLQEYKETSKFEKLRIFSDKNKYNLLDRIFEIEINGSYINRIVIMEILIELVQKNKSIINSNDYEKYKRKLFEHYNIIKNESVPKKYLEYRINERLEEIGKKLIGK